MSEQYLYEQKVKSNVELNIWSAFPAIYNFGMSALGYLSIFRRLDEQVSYFVERVFADTTETQLKVQDVDVMTFSMSFELDFLTIFKMLEKYNIPFNNISISHGMFEGIFKIDRRQLFSDDLYQFIYDNYTII